MQYSGDDVILRDTFIIITILADILLKKNIPFPTLMTTGGNLLIFIVLSILKSK